MPPTTPHPPAHRWLVSLLVLLALLAPLLASLNACQRPDDAVSLPAGYVLMGDVLALRRVAQAMGASPLAVGATARRITAQLASCQAGDTPLLTGDALETLALQARTAEGRCRAAPDALARAAAITLLLPGTSSTRTMIRISDVKPDGRFDRVHVELHGDDTTSNAMASIEASAHTDVLQQPDAVAHAHVRFADGVPWPALVPSALQLLLRAAFAGDVELVVPTTADRFAPVAAFAAASPAVATRALAGLVAWAEAALSTTAEHLDVAGHDAQCLERAQLAPGVRPCALVLGDRLLVAMNRNALTQTLAHALPASSGKVAATVDVAKLLGTDPVQAIGLPLATLAATVPQRGVLELTTR